MARLQGSLIGIAALLSSLSAPATEKAHIELRPGRVLILSSADMMKDDFLAMQGDYQNNLNFFSSAIETFGLDERLLKIQRKTGATKDEILGISEPMKQIVSNLKDDITVRYYISDDVPSFLMDLKRDTIDVLRALEPISKGHFKWEVIVPEVKSREIAEAKVLEYFEAKARGEKPKEPARKESFAVSMSLSEPDPTDQGVQGPVLTRYRELVDRTKHEEGFIAPKTLAVYMEGTFPFKYQDGPVPGWKEEQKKGGDF